MMNGKQKLELHHDTSAKRRKIYTADESIALMETMTELESLSSDNEFDEAIAFVVLI